MSPKCNKSKNTQVQVHLLSKQKSPLRGVAIILHRNIAHQYKQLVLPLSSLCDMMGRQNGNIDTTSPGVPITEPAPAMTDPPGPHDVLLGRGAPITEHEGNARLRQVVVQHHEAYATAIDRSIKHRVALTIIEDVKRRGGRFLRLRNGSQATTHFLHFMEDASLWEPVTDFKVILCKVKQLLRDMGPEAQIRRKGRKRLARRNRVPTATTSPEVAHHCVNATTYGNQAETVLLKAHQDFNAFGMAESSNSKDEPKATVTATIAPMIGPNETPAIGNAVTNNARLPSIDLQRLTSLLQAAPPRTNPSNVHSNGGLFQSASPTSNVSMTRNLPARLNPNETRFFVSGQSSFGSSSFIPGFTASELNQSPNDQHQLRSITPLWFASQHTASLPRITPPTLHDATTLLSMLARQQQQSGQPIHSRSDVLAQQFLLSSDPLPSLPTAPSTHVSMNVLLQLLQRTTGQFPQSSSPP